MTHLPDSDLRELEGLLGKATPGPWKVEGAPQLAKGAQTVVTSVAPWPLEIGPSWHDWTLDVSRFVAETRTEDDSGEPDAALIVAAVNALPSLIADLREARERIAWRDIKSAPTDGSDLLMICASAYTPTATVGWWLDGWRTYLRAGDGEKFSSGVTLWFPTHWMPLPDAPARIKEKG